MKLEVGKWYKTREGKKVFVYAVDQPDRCTRLAYINYEDWVKGRLFMNGMANSDSGIKRPYDLIEEWKDETSMASPIQEKTVKELVPGVYGRFNIQYNEDRNELAIQLSNGPNDFRNSHLVPITSSELRTAAKTFNEIADYLDEQK